MLSRWRGHAGYSECVLCLCEKYCILLQGKDIPLMMNAIQAFWWKILGLTRDSMTRGLAIFAPCPLSSTFSYGHARHICIAELVYETLSPSHWARSIQVYLYSFWNAEEFWKGNTMINLVPIPQEVVRSGEPLPLFLEQNIITPLFSYQRIIIFKDGGR